jgi:hypothetical protein
MTQKRPPATNVIARLSPRAADPLAVANLGYWPGSNTLAIDGLGLCICLLNRKATPNSQKTSQFSDVY